MRLALVGDVMLGRLVNEVLRGAPPEYPWGDTLPTLLAADLRVCNLECAISDRGAPWTATPKVFHFRTDAKNVAVLRAGHMDAVSLANNHTLDYGYEALSDTQSTLDAARVARAGAGQTLAEAAQPAIVEAGGRRVGLLAFTDNEAPWEAAPETPGIWYVPVDERDPRAAQLFAAVGRTKEHVDLLIVSAHWGPNWGYAPPAPHVPFARHLIEAGADVVFGHSGHVVRGVELYRRRPILYCAGDFIDDYAVDPVERNDRSFIFALEVDGQEARRLRMYPTIIGHFQARMAGADEAEAIARKMQRLCAALGTDTVWRPDEGCLEAVVPAPAAGGP